MRATVRRQDDFQWEGKLNTKNWSIRFNNSILVINDVDTYYLGKSCEWGYSRNPAEFYCNIAKEMIDNRWTERRTRRNQAGQPIEYTGYIINIFHCCTPTKNKREIKTPNGLKGTKLLAQSRCKVCRGKPTYVCSNCGDCVCHDKSGRLCLYTHCEEKN